MALFNLMKHRIGTEKEAQEPPKQAIFVQQSSKAGLLVTSELGKALRDCEAKVDRISRDCRMKNRKFRDLEFDLEYDSRRCLHGLGGNNEIYLPSDVQRVTEIFDSPQFFVDGVSFAYPVGGDISNSWFVSALATVARKRGLIKRLCVARDEQVGVYGFIFFKDSAWVTVIIDDLLYTCIPKFEALSPLEKQLYHDNKQFYNTHARKGTKSLYFAKSATQGETWVPLIEKAYAKLYGSYAALVGGDASEAIEDLTGGVSTFIPTRDIFDTDRFWYEELLKTNVDRLFGCTYEALSGVRSGNWSSQVHGLVGNYSYSVVRAVEVNGKRFVVVRGPASGQTGWTGPWSDGSKEWTKEWAELLPEIGHVLGEDGQFVMEYKDFLNCWDTFDKTLLFDDSWVMSSQWLHVATRPLPAWTFGNVSFTFSLSQSTHAVIVLSQIDDRSFYEISGRSSWELDFVLFKAGKKQVVTESFPNQDYARSVNVEVDLEAGDYIVHVRLDHALRRDLDYYEKNYPVWDKRSLSRMLSEQAVCQSITSNLKEGPEKQNIPVPLDILAGQDLNQIASKALALAKAEKKEEEENRKKFSAAAGKDGWQYIEMHEETSPKQLEAGNAEVAIQNSPSTGPAPEQNATDTIINPDGSTTVVTTSTVTSVVKRVICVTTKKIEDGTLEEVTMETREEMTRIPVVTGPNGQEVATVAPAATADSVSLNSLQTYGPTCSNISSDDTQKDGGGAQDLLKNMIEAIDDNSVFLGLKVYTKGVPVNITGQLRNGVEFSSKLALDS